MDCSQSIQDQIAERNATRRNNGNNGTTRTIVNTPTNAAPAPANSNSTSRMAQILQPCAQLAALPVVPIRTPNTITNLPAIPRLTTKEMERLMKFGRCFNCKEEGHISRNCMRSSKPYLSVSAALQEVELVEDSASETGKD